MFGCTSDLWMFCVLLCHDEYTDVCLCGRGTLSFQQVLGRFADAETGKLEPRGFSFSRMSPLEEVKSLSFKKDKAHMISKQVNSSETHATIHPWHKKRKTTRWDAENIRGNVTKIVWCMSLITAYWEQKRNGNGAGPECNTSGSI